MLHRASSPSPVPPIPPIPPSAAVTRTHGARRLHGSHASGTPQRQPQPQPPPTLPEKACRVSATGSTTTTTTTSQGPSNNPVPPVPPPLSAPRPPKAGGKEALGIRQDHHYENTFVICGPSHQVVKNLTANRAAGLRALMMARDDPGGGGGGCGSMIKSSAESAAYENVNVEHITRLTALGFAQDAVIRALGITRNDLEMACDILHEFATKSS